MRAFYIVIPTMGVSSEVVIAIVFMLLLKDWILLRVGQLRSLAF